MWSQSENFLSIPLIGLSPSPPPPPTHTNFPWQISISMKLHFPTGKFGGDKFELALIIIAWSSPLVSHAHQTPQYSATLLSSESHLLIAVTKVSVYDFVSWLALQS